MEDWYIFPLEEQVSHAPLGRCSNIAIYIDVSENVLLHLLGVCYYTFSVATGSY